MKKIIFDYKQKIKNDRVHLLDFEPFENTFGPKAHRKRAQLNTCDINVRFIARQNYLKSINK